MSGRVSQSLIIGVVAVAGFFIGSRIEPMIDGPARAYPAEARGIATAPTKPLAKAEPLNSGSAHNEAIQSGTAPEAAEAPAAVAIAAAPAPATEDKPSMVSGKDPESDAEFIEMKNLPEVQGEAEPDATPGRDVDMIGEQGVPIPDKSGTEADTKLKSSN